MNNKYSKTRSLNSIKKGMSFIISTVLIFSVLSVSGCNNFKPFDLPEEGVENTSENNGKIEESINPVEPENTDSFSDGQFVFNPEAINQYYLDELKDKPIQIKLAKRILKAVYDLETEFELTGEYECEEEDFVQALRLARLSNPMVNCTSVSLNDSNTVKIVYYPPYSQSFDSDDNSYKDEVGNDFREFELFVTETINKIISFEDDSIERAKKIYSVLVNELELDYDAERIINTNGSVSENIIECNNTDIIKVPETGKLPFWSFMGLYQFFLTQLDVEYICVVGGGDYNETEFEKINEYKLELEFVWFWTIITDGGNAYNTDILMDKIALDSQRESNASRESDLLFFGMSDDTRKKSFNYQARKLVMTMYPLKQIDKQIDLPECKTDY